ncbi:MAG: SIMPL domain-containing protein [Patescibacteria group bacterium]
MLENKCDYAGDGGSCCSHWRSPKTWLAVLAVLMLGTVVIVAILRDRIVNQPQWQISVTGKAELYYQPDTANVNIGVQVDKAAKADDALKQLNEKMDKIYQALTNLGIAKEDIQTQNYSVSPQYDYLDNTTSLSGYNANQTLTIKIKNVETSSDLVAKVIEAATAAGANQINGVNFETSKLEELRQELRLKANADARNKAGAIADSLDVKLGDIVGWWENSYPIESSYYGYDKAMGIGGGGGSPVVPVGEQKLQTEVSISYKLK